MQTTGACSVRLAVSGLSAFAAEHRLTASQFTGIGAFKNALLGYFDGRKKNMRKFLSAIRSRFFHLWETLP
jgi:predicted DNA-binding protein with PD1-like motif